MTLENQTEGYHRNYECVLYSNSHCTRLDTHCVCIPGNGKGLRTCEDVVLVSDGDPGVVFKISELDFASSDHRVSSVAIVVVLQTAVVDHR